MYPQYISACPDKLTDKEQLRKIESFVKEQKITEPTHEVFLTTSPNEEDIFINVKILDPNVKASEVKVDCNKMFSTLKAFIGKICFGKKSNQEAPKEVGNRDPQKDAPESAQKPVEDTKEII